MVLLLNIAFALLAGWFVNWLLEAKFKMDSTPAAIIAVIVGIVVFLANLASEIV